MNEPKPGDFFVTGGGGLAGAVVRWGSDSRWSHAGIYAGDGQVLEAMPSGARLTPVDTYLGEGTLWSTEEIDATTRTLLSVAARSMVGIPYGWAEIIAVALGSKRLGKHVDTTLPMDQQPWWVRNLADTDCQICSQLVDYIHLLCGRHLFNDGRPFGLVSPGDLGGLITC
jgi:hypothetical protein